MGTIALVGILIALAPIILANLSSDETSRSDDRTHQSASGIDEAIPDDAPSAAPADDPKQHESGDPDNSLTGADRPKEAALVATGDALRRFGRTAEALDFYDRALTKDATDADAHDGRALALLDLGREADALDAVESAIALAPNNPRFHLDRALALSRLDRFDDGLYEIAEALRLQPEYHDAMVYQSWFLRELGLLEDADRVSRQVVQAAPGYANAHLERAEVLRALGEYLGAERAALHSIELAPEYSEPRNVLGGVLRARGLYQEAVDAYDQAIALAPDSATYRRNKGLVLEYDLLRHHEAAVEFRQAVELSPQWLNPRVNLGFTLLNLDRPEESAKTFARALFFDLANSDAHRGLGLALEKLGLPERALWSFDVAARLNPGDADPHEARGRVLLRSLGRPAEALAAFREARRLAPDSARHYLNIGDAHAALKDFDRAIDAYDQGLRLEPDGARLLLQKGYAQFRIGDSQSAVVTFDLLVKRHDQWPIAHVYRGFYGLDELGRFDEALEAIDLGLFLDPDNAYGYYCRAWVLSHRFDRDLEALDNYETSLRLDPDQGFIMGLRLSLLVELDLREEALDAFGDLVTRDERKFESPGERHQLIDQAVRSVAPLGSAVLEVLEDASNELRPWWWGADDHEILWARAIVLGSGLGRYDEARQIFDRILELGYQGGDLFMERGYVAYLGGDYEPALSDYEQAVLLMPTNEGARQGLYLVFRALGRPAEALDAIDATIEIDPGDFMNHVFRGTTLLELGRLDEALQAMEKAVSLEPNDARPRLGEATVLVRLGRFEEARLLYESVLKIDPANTEAERGLRELQP